MATPTVEDFVAVQVAIREDRTLTVSGMPTSCPHLAVTPRVQIADGGQPVMCGGFVLTHRPSGRTIAADSSPGRLLDLAGRLERFDWDFPAFSAMGFDYADVRVILRQWALDEAPPPAFLSRDDAATRQARASAPARTLLEDQITRWLRHFEESMELSMRLVADELDHPPGETISGDRRLYLERMLNADNGYGVVLLLAVLFQLDPAVADAAANHLVAAWEDGEIGERVYRWAAELQATGQITLAGMPQSGQWREAGSPADTLKAVIERLNERIARFELEREDEASSGHRPTGDDVIDFDTRIETLVMARDDIHGLLAATFKAE